LFSLHLTVIVVTERSGGFFFLPSITPLTSTGASGLSIGMREVIW